MEFGKSVFVPSIGWAIFGQLGNKLNRSQVLPTLDGEWQEGPELADPNAHKLNQCMFQVSELVKESLIANVSIVKALSYQAN